MILGNVDLKHGGVGITAEPAPVIVVIVLPTTWYAVTLAVTVLPTRRP
jgi:hypothetical protein